MVAGRKVSAVKGRKVRFNRKKKYNQNITSIVKSIVNAGTEQKYHDVTLTGGPSANSELTLLNGLTLNTQSTGRIGQRVIIKSLEIKGYWASALSNFTLNHVAIVIDHESNGTAPTYADIFPSTTIYAPFHSMVDRQRFTILKEWRFTCDGGTAAGDIQRDKWLRYYKKLDMRVNYNSGSTGTITDIEQGALYLVLNTTSNSVQTRVCQTRIRYSDN